MEVAEELAENRPNHELQGYKRNSRCYYAKTFQD